MTITEFLEARIAEDEAVARDAAESDPSIQGHYMDQGPAGSSWTAEDGMVLSESGDMWDCEGSSTLCTTTEVAEHFARHDPARVLAECAAKRFILTMYQTYVQVASERTGIAAFGAECGRDVTGDALKPLAAVYKGHPDYEQEWA